MMETVRYEIRYTMAKDGWLRTFSVYDDFDVAKRKYDELVAMKEFISVRIEKVIRVRMEFTDKAI